MARESTGRIVDALLYSRLDLIEICDGVTKIFDKLCTKVSPNPDHILWCYTVQIFDTQALPFLNSACSCSYLFRSHLVENLAGDRKVFNTLLGAIYHVTFLWWFENEDLTPIQWNCMFPNLAERVSQSIRYKPGHVHVMAGGKLPSPNELDYIDS